MNAMMGGLPLKLASRTTSTINGKTLKQIEEELFADIDVEDIKSKMGFDFVPIENLIDRLDSVVGAFNYTFVPMSLPYEEIHYTAVPNKELMEKEVRDGKRKSYTEEDLQPKECVERLERVITALIIYNDEGEAVIIKYGFGSSSYKVGGAEGKLYAPNNVPGMAFSDANKRASKHLGIAQKQLREKKEGREQTGSTNQGMQVKASNYEVILQGSFSSKNRGCYVAPIVDLSTGEKLELFVGSEKKISEGNLKILLGASKGQTVKVAGYSKTYNNKQQIVLIDVTR